jgi:ABC-type multidrug transport system ATPase subunit
VTLLAFDHVSKHFARGDRGASVGVALQNVSFEVDEGDVVVVWGRRRSGRTTLLGVAAGIEAPTEGAVRFDGMDLTREPMLGVAGGIAYCTTRFERALGDSVLEHVTAPVLGSSVSLLQAQRRALETLRRTGADGCAAQQPGELDHTETTRVTIARALVTQPRLLLIDEPTYGVPPAGRRDEILALLRSIAHRDGVAVLMTVDEASDLAGADRALSIDAGEVRGETIPTTAVVVPLRRSGS